MKITSDQIRAARALLRIEQSDLAQRAQVSVVTVRRLETIEGFERVTPLTLQGIRKALEHAGAEFIPDGVRRRQVAREHTKTLFEDLRAISLRDAERLHDHDMLTEADLYDEAGLPA